MSVNRVPVASRLRGSAFVLCTALATAGGAIALISATGITTAAGQLSRGAIYSGIYLAVTLLAGALALPFAPISAHRFGTRQTFLGLMSLMAGGWLAAGLLVSAGLPGLPVVMLTAPVIGASGGMIAVLSPIVYRSYLASVDVSSAVAHMTIYKGIAWGLGALAGGLALNAGAEGAGMVIAGLLKIPIVISLARQTPSAALPEPAAAKAPWHEVRENLKQSATLRRAAAVGVGMALFVAPAMSLTVPIAQSLRHAPLYQGAGLLMAGFAVGELLSPAVVHRLRVRRTPIVGSAASAVMAGVFLLILGLVSSWFSFRTELALWAVVAVGIGAFRFASRALSQGASAEALGHERAAAGLASVELCSGLAAPIGVLAWSVALGAFGASVAAVAAGAGLCLVAVIVLRAAAHRDQSSV